jgi:hypothetical protein
MDRYTGSASARYVFVMPCHPNGSLGIVEAKRELNHVVVIVLEVDISRELGLQGRQRGEWNDFVMARHTALSIAVRRAFNVKESMAF